MPMIREGDGAARPAMRADLGRLAWFLAAAAVLAGLWWGVQ